ncbi:MAG: hypothetical protein HY268_22955 [Deltaproteobacteria bacterium]|nr:hypothetical protein [Deltaproteobacteria bacterium]
MPRFETVQVQLASNAYMYLRRAFELGALEGPSIGQMKLHPAVQQLMQAIHHVLAGGELEDRLLKNEGDPAIVEELERRMKQVIEETNLINDEAGFYKAIVAF